MAVMGTDKLEYIQTVFKGLGAENKERILTTARTLLEIQEDTINPTNKKTSPKPKKNKL